MQKSCRESYGDNAIGYVQVKRTDKIIDIIGKMTSEHRLSSTPYTVKAQVDEREMCLKFVTCHGCVASQGKAESVRSHYFGTNILNFSYVGVCSRIRYVASSTDGRTFANVNSLLLETIRSLYRQRSRNISKSFSNE